MAYVPSIPLLHSLTLNHRDDGPRTPTSGKQNQTICRSSLASLAHFARNPIENVGEAVQNWYDGTTKEERTRRQSLADRKQLLYLKMRVVGLPLVPVWALLQKLIQRA